MIDYVEEFHVDLSKYPEGTTKEKFNALFEEGMKNGYDIVPHKSKNYEEKILECGFSFADFMLNPNDPLRVLIDEQIKSLNEKKNAPLE